MNNNIINREILAIIVKFIGLFKWNQETLIEMFDSKLSSHDPNTKKIDNGNKAYDTINKMV